MKPGRWISPADSIPNGQRVAEAAAATDPATVPTKIAVLVSEASGMTLSRMHQVLREDQGGSQRIRLFWDRNECLDWLERAPQG